MKQEQVLIKNICKSYSSKKVNDNITVDLFSHQITALIGHNGAGKTTLLNQINGLILPNNGDILVKGISVKKYPSKIRQLVATMPQFQVPLKGVTMQEAVESIGLIRGLSLIEIRHRTQELFQELDVTKWKNEKGERLSGGLQRLTSFAMTVIDKAPVIVLDEPTNDVDPIRRKLIWNYLRKLADEGATIIVVSHNLFEVERYADRYILMNQGKVVADMLISKKTSRAYHLLRINGISRENSQLFKDFKTNYSENGNQLTVVSDEKNVLKIVELTLNLLKKSEITSYELQPKQLSDDYEELCDKLL